MIIENEDFDGVKRTMPRIGHARFRRRVSPALSVTPPHTRERIDIISRAKHEVTFDKQSILNAATNHERYVIRQSVLRNLPTYDDCTPHGVSPEAAKNLLEEEIDKIINFAGCSDPPVFDSNGSLTGTSRRDFEDVSGLADQMICNLAVLRHDNSRHGVEMGTAIAGDAWDILTSSRTHLRSRYAKDEMHVEGRQPVLLADPEKNVQAYHSLLDYVLATMAWWIVRYVDSNFWKSQIIAILAQWALKMKVIAIDPVRCTEKTLAETSSLIDKLKYQTEHNDPLIKIGGKKKDVDSIQTKTNLCNLYCEEKMFFRAPLENILEDNLAALIKHERSGIEAELFEICTMIYRNDTKLEAISNILSGHRHGDILASASLQHINFCYSMFMLLERNTKVVSRQIQQSPPPSSGDFVRATLALSGDKETQPELILHRMDHVISLLVPLVIMNPSTARQITGLMHVAMGFDDSGDIVRQFEPPPHDFALEYTLSTKAWLSKSDLSSGGRLLDPDIQPLAQSPLRRGVHGVSNSVRGQTTKILEEYDPHLKEMMTWEIHASNITVSCKRYVRCAQALATLLVLGGLAIPFCARNRISGVDPFQIATYTWLIAGFQFVIAKSIYVNSWPWHDFLGGRVVCQSVSNLSEVYKIKPQLILLFLLRNEWNNLLITKGPYNGMFSRSLDPRSTSKSQKRAVVAHQQAFSIDEPTHISTMLASGLIPIKVRNAMGDHLICIDGRKGYKWDAAVQRRHGNWITCRNFNHEDLESMRDSRADDNTIGRKVHMLERVEFKWTKVLGVYVKDSKFG